MAEEPAVALLEYSVITWIYSSSVDAFMKAAPASLCPFFSSPVMTT